MITVADADAILYANLWNGSAETVPLQQSLQRVLAQAVYADRPFPPFDRVTMDGIALSFAVFASGIRDFPITFQQMAGEPARSLAALDHCAEVMTGAMLPMGADCVVRYEDVKIQKGIATIEINDVQHGQNIHRQGSDAPAGEILLSAGTTITAAEIQVLASVGLASVLVKALPRTAIVSNGDELVDIHQTPASHQLRKSNVYALAAALIPHGITPELFHLPDNAVSIQTICKQLTKNFDLIILSGGVSKGKADFIPEALTQCGIEKKFHQISQRPGKPMWFGVGKNQAVFALPGNPVSTFLCCYRYVLPWLAASLGTTIQQPYVRLGQDFTFKPALTYFLQVKLSGPVGAQVAEPLPGGGSGDFINLKAVDGFLELPLGGQTFKKGDAYRFIGFR
jgi:molybdopterin molybdotransferase